MRTTERRTAGSLVVGRAGGRRVRGRNVGAGPAVTLRAVPLSPLIARYDHILLDLDGCVWLGDEPTPGAVDAVAALRAAGKGVAFVTNDSQLSTEEYVRKLWRLGFQASLEEVVTVGGALQFVLAERFTRRLGLRHRLAGAASLRRGGRPAGRQPHGVRQPRRRRRRRLSSGVRLRRAARGDARPRCAAPSSSAPTATRRSPTPTACGPARARSSPPSSTPRGARSRRSESPSRRSCRRRWTGSARAARS